MLAAVAESDHSMCQLEYFNKKDKWNRGIYFLFFLEAAIRFYGSLNYLD
jgi:hypothetical protein